ncbi:chemotaxis protein CheD [Chitinibacter sp. SCUT-21]|uniref:chemotaxis protein CheD n=1 Tax=Chitinibacter sp. SCUT-21 TaxID=2970891 RepID=UPI0035A6B6E1
MTATPAWLHIEEKITHQVIETECSSLHPHHLEMQAHNIMAGEVAVHHHHPIKTVLGSCIAVCLFDPQLKLIGMNHFLVPLRHSRDDQEGYFSGLASMEVLVNEMMKAGAAKRRIVAKAFGGGDMLGLDNMVGMGQKNIEFTQSWLQAEHIPLTAVDWGGNWARKVIFEPVKGDVYCRRIEAKLPKARQLAQEEQRFAEKLVRQQQKPRIDFFD